MLETEGGVLSSCCDHCEVLRNLETQRGESEGVLELNQAEAGATAIVNTVITYNLHHGQVDQLLLFQERQASLNHGQQ